MNGNRKLGRIVNLQRLEHTPHASIVNIAKTLLRADLLQIDHDYSKEESLRKAVVQIMNKLNKVCFTPSGYTEAVIASAYILSISIREDTIGNISEEIINLQKIHENYDEYPSLHEESPIDEFAPSNADGVQVFSFSEMFKINPKDFREELRSSVKETRELLEEKGSNLPRFVFTPKMKEGFKQLRKDFPNATEVLNYIEGSLINYTVTNGKSEMPKVIVAGEPGIGKSAVFEALSRVLCADYFDVPISILSDGFYLTGLDRSWGSGKSGEIFNIALKSTTASPIVFLDEIDKCKQNAKHSSVENVLLQLAEPGNAQKFKDEFYKIHFDCSKWILIATANDTSALSDPLLSRFEVISMNMPSESECVKVVQRIAQSKFSHLEFDDEAIEIISKSGKNFREMKRILNRAAQQAALSIEDPVSFSSVKMKVPTEVVRSVSRAFSRIRAGLGFV